MPKNKPAPATAADIKEIVDLLDSRFDDAGSVVEVVAGLRESVEKLTRTVQALEATVDDLRGDVEWIMHQGEGLRTAASARPLTSMPADPLAGDFSGRVNRHAAADLPPQLQAPRDSAPEAAPRQPDLF